MDTIHWKQNAINHLLIAIKSPICDLGRQCLLDTYLTQLIVSKSISKKTFVSIQFCYKFFLLKKWFNLNKILNIGSSLY